MPRLIDNRLRALRLEVVGLEVRISTRGGHWPFFGPLFSLLDSRKGITYLSLTLTRELRDQFRSNMGADSGPLRAVHLYVRNPSGLIPPATYGVTSGPPEMDHSQARP